MAVTRPTNYSTPFANGGLKNTIPTGATGTGKASFTEGFPTVTMTPIVSGGIPPEGKDFNGIFYSLSSHTVWVNAGGQYQFDSALSTAIGGYPAGAVLQNNAGTASYVSAVANNTTDFNTTPSSIGTLWLPYSGASTNRLDITTTGGTIALTSAQATNRIISVSGALTANVTLVMPSGVIGEWYVINLTTGAFEVGLKPNVGAQVRILQGGGDTVVIGINPGGPARYGQSTGVTRSPGDNTTALATTEFVAGAVTNASFLQTNFNYFLGQL